jgi:hypothetical protein
VKRTTNGHGQPLAECPSCGKPAQVTPYRNIDGKFYHRPCWLNETKRRNREGAK